MTAKTTAPKRFTAKGHRLAGVDLTQPVMFFGFGTESPNEGGGTRKELLEVIGGRGVYAVEADGSRSWLGGTATKFWLAQADDTPEPEVTVTDVNDADPIVGGKHLSEMSFAEVMRLAKVYRTPGRGTARIAALRAGVAEAINRDAGALAGIIS